MFVKDDVHVMQAFVVSAKGYWAGFLWTGVTSTCQSLEVDSKNRIQVLTKSANVFNCWSIFPFPVNLLPKISNIYTRISIEILLKIIDLIEQIVSWYYTFPFPF